MTEKAKRQNAVGNEIFQQIGGGAAMVMIGGKNIGTLQEEEGGLRFGFKAKAKNRANLCVVVLTALDLYTVKFFRVWGCNCNEISQHTDIYNDMLRDLFQNETGLALSLY